MIFNPSIANTHWTDALKIVSESMLVQCTKSKAQRSQFFNTTYIRHSEHGVFNRPYRVKQLALKLSQCDRISNRFIRYVPFIKTT